MDTNFDVHVGDYVKISLRNDPTMYSKGEVFKKTSEKDSANISVVLKNGAAGTVIQVINSIEIIKKRIMREDQYTENKSRFGEDVMRHNVIPKTVQSFLNSEGGYLYIGIRDTGELKERLIGLDYDFNRIDHSTKKLSNDKLCDKLGINIMDSLEKYLKSNISLGPLIKIIFREIFNIQFIEIIIKKSPQPWFFKNMRNGKEVLFDIHRNDGTVDKRRLDEFYIRSGGSKKRLETHEEFHNYFIGRFTNNNF
ncbi:MAG: hypothetical protein K8823_942 [Cenarchaeum symbiont of Oopsacas minuta]|nr:hypothetical protein [Cenarchaeum symbiont of Oopsacas minuta]